MIQRNEQLVIVRGGEILLPVPSAGFSAADIR